jgi:cysteine synthase B
MVAATLGYRMILVMPENQSVERRALMKAFGAEIILVTQQQGMEGARDLALKMQAQGEGRVLDQFANPDNPRAQYEGTGPEIWRDTGGRITHFVSSMGTTGTIMGCSRFLKERNPQVQVIGVQPDGESSIPGIRKWPEAYLPKIFDRARVDRVVEVGAAAATDMTRALAATEGLFCGPSAGGTVWAALELARELDGATLVAIIPDRGDRYISTGVFPP